MIELDWLRYISVELGLIILLLCAIFAAVVFKP